MKNARFVVLAIVAAMLALVAAPPTPTSAATFTVDSADNFPDLSPDGVCATSPATGSVCTLRAAIQEANASPFTADTINFNISGAGPHTIMPSTGWPTINGPVTLDGFTQPGADPNTNSITQGSNAVLKIELNGTNAGPGATGLLINSAGSTIRGLVINAFNQNGIELSSGGNVIAGNHIGTNVAGTFALANAGSGVFISSTSTNTIGGETAADRNVISGNLSHGITITGAAATENVVWGNFIGTQADRVTALGNGQDGVHIDTSASNNEIGDVVSDRANTIAFNNGDGVFLSGFPFPTGNAIRANSIHSNTGMGIDFDPNGVNPNDAGDSDGGANNGQNWPELTLAVSGGGHTNVHGTLNSTPSTNFFLDFYHSGSCDAGGNGEGEVYLGSVLMATLASGNASFAFSFPTTVAAGRVVTATATRQSTLDTSEFSNCVTAGPLVVDTTLDDNLTACTPSAVGDCSLRGALTNANAGNTPGDLILFDTTVFPSGAPATITIDGTGLGALPSLNTIGGSDTIDGTGAGVVLDGAGEPSLFPCLSIENVGNTVKGLQMTDCSSGINIIGDSNTIGPGNVLFDNGDAFGGAGVSIGTDGTGNSIKGNKIGTNAAGSGVHPDGGNNTGVRINGGGNTVGGASPADRNIISGNGTGINISTGGISGAGNNNFVKGNYIGTDVSGTVDLGNTLTGVGLVQAVSGNIIGGTAAGEGNLISGNNGNGVRIFGTNAIGRPSGNSFQGNFIGTNASGTADLGNMLDGILIDGGVNTCIGGAIVASVCAPTANGRNVISGNDLSGVEIIAVGANGNKLFGNYIGTDVTGMADLGNSQHGVNIESGTANVIGSPAGPNVISGNNQNGVRISGAASNLVGGNLIGANAGGTGPLGNTNQNVRLDNADNNFIEFNVIAASGDAGVRISNFSNSNIVFANFIGTDASGTIPLGNAGHGVHVLSSNNTIGGTGAGEANAIAFNGGDGVRVDGAAETATGNRVRGNAVHHNIGKGIETINLGNSELAPPTVTSAGSAAGTATCVNTPCDVDVYSDTADEGRVYHGSTTVSSGTWSFGGVVVGPNVTAIITDALGNTSEFSSPFACPDPDGDLLCNSSDPCPGDGDCDNDGWMDGSEANFIETDPQDACADTATPNDERGPGFGQPVPPWPPDFNDDGSVTGADLSAVAGVIGQGVPPAPPRRDVNQPPDGAITGADLSAVAGKIGTSCVP